MGLLTTGTVGLVGMTIFAIVTDVRMQEPQLAVAKAAAAEPASALQKLDVAGVYESNCMACHGVDGTGNQLRVAMPTIPDLTDSDWQRKTSDEGITAIIRDGKEPLMPAYKDKLSEHEILALTSYLRAFAPEETEPTVP